MGKKILIISIISTFLLLTISQIPAFEYKICSDNNVSQNYTIIKNNNLSKIENNNKLKNIKFFEIRNLIHNIDIDVLKENILKDIKNSELTIQQKLFAEKLLSSNGIINIFLKGIILPIILYTIAYHNIKIIPNALGLLSVVIIGWIVPQYLIIPASKDIQEKTNIPWYISFIIMAIFDNTVSFLISSKLTII